MSRRRAPSSSRTTGTSSTPCGWGCSSPSTASTSSSPDPERGPSVNWITAWRRRPWAGYAVVLAALAIIGVTYAGLAPGTGRADAAPGPSQDIAKGKELFNQNCSSCHGANAEGTDEGPSLLGVGAA